MTEPTTQAAVLHDVLAAMTELMADGERDPSVYLECVRAKLAEIEGATSVAWLVEGRRGHQPEFRSTTTLPDGTPGSGLRHHWTERVGALWLSVIGPDLDAALAEYRRLWAERTVC